MELLDRIDPARYDTDAIVDAANRFDELSEEEQETYLGLWEYAGLDQAEHLFTSLLFESHNATCVVRDLDGDLQLLWEAGPVGAPGTWARGPLHRGNLADDETIEYRLGELIEDEQPDFTVDTVKEIIAALPAAPGSVVQF